jgi:hypothetical protein
MMNDPFAGLKSSNAGFTSKQTTNNMSTSVDMMVHIPLGNDGIGGSASNSVSNETKQAKEEGKEDFHTEVGSRASSTDNERNPVEDEVARFKRERKERIRGLKLSQTIKEEEEARRRADEEAAKFRAEEHEARKTIKLLDRINTAANQEQSEHESTGDEGKVEDHVAPETSPTQVNTKALQKEEEERMAAQAEAARQEARLAAEAEAEAARLEKEEEERMTSQAEAARQEARLAAEAETARLEKEEEERMAKQEARVAAEAEAAILQKEEEEERMAAQAEAARQKARLAAEAEAARLEKEEEERMTKQAEVVRLQKIAMEYKLKKRMEERVAAQTRAARLQKEQEDQEDQAAQLATENKRNSARRPLSANSARRPLSAALKKYRDRHEQKEDELRDIMQGISITNSAESDKSLVSYADTDSLVSHNRDLARGASLKWERLYLPFCFGLLTTEEEAPRTGPYQPHETIENGSMLQKIMTKVGSSSKEVLEQSTGNVIMKSQDPFVTAVKRDGTY